MYAPGVALTILSTLLVWAVVGSGCRHEGPAASGSPQARRMVITVDDLPVATRIYRDQPEKLAQITRKLLEATRGRDVPVIGFVNEAKLSSREDHPAQSVDLLEAWVASGADLGNHTFDHVDLHRVPVERFVQEIARGEKVTRSLLEKAGKRPKYFRHPYLHTGRDAETRQTVGQFLTERGYRVAPVTVDNYDYIYARAYERALARDDTALAKQIGVSYVEYMLRYVEFYERTSRDLLGYELPQILLIHANAINADYLGVLVERIRSRGYRYVDLDEALRDPAFQSDDRYFGPAGITWLHRWALTKGIKGKFYHGEPPVDEYVSELLKKD